MAGRPRTKVPETYSSSNGAGVPVMYLKVQEFANKVGVRYFTAWRWFRDGYIKGCKTPSGSILIGVEMEEGSKARAAMDLIEEIRRKAGEGA